MKTLKKKMMRKSVLPTLLALVLSMVIVLTGTGSSTQTSSTTTVYLDPPTINGTAIGVGNTIMVNINIRGAPNVYGWQAGLTFNPDVLECTDISEGDFLSNVGDTFWFPFTINNTVGNVTGPGSQLLGEITASGDGQLAYLNFKVKASGFSDLHLRDVIVSDFELKMVPFNIVDVYTAVVGTTHYKVVTVSNSTGFEIVYIDGESVYVHSGLYDHAFSAPDKEISFSVTGPYPAFSNVTIPKTLLPPPEPPYVWAVVLDGTPFSTEKRTVTENQTHTSIYFMYSEGIHDVQTTTRFMPSTISIVLSEDSISKGESVTINGNVTGADNIVRKNVTVTIHNRTEGDVEWGTLATVKTNLDGIYSYAWTPETTGTYELKASWEGDENTLPEESDVKTLKVKGAGIPLEIVVAAVVTIIIIAAIVVYFVKIRKPKEAE